VRLLLLTIGILLSIPSLPAQSQESDAKARVAKLATTLKASLPKMISARAKGLGPEARVGVAVTDSRTGTVVFEHNADQAFAVASNAKIITAAAALSLLGPEFKFRTELLAEPVDAKGNIPGDLYLRGRGNAAFDSADMANLVRGLKALGVTRVNGGIVVDNSYFDDVNLPPHFDEQPEEHAAFRAPVAATSYTFNAYTLIVRPSLSGAGPARIEVTPPNDYVRVNSTVSTITTGRSRIKMDTKQEASRLVINLSGQVRKEVRRRRFRKRVPDPTLFVGTGLKRALANAGITVRKPGVKSGAAPATAVALAVHESAPLAVTVRGMGKFSNNFVAEQLLKVIGAETRAAGQPATWEHGLQAVRGELAKAGLSEGSYRFENGSGLFDSNQFTPQQIIKVLQWGTKDFRWGPELLASLSLSAADGTLSRRMVGTAAARKVRAKTGTLEKASALSGVAADDWNSPLLFSILVNGFPETATGIARALQDEIANELIRAQGP
jgi:D-alanyl-D-alanine carboxypeptidase/D-alanyl-D-alanine-endopeptidase (penicillin-binding protein 4)